MNARKIFLSIVTTGLLLLATATLALAWPEQPPDKATISGPGLKGEVQITDKQVLQTLKLGTLEDLNSASSPIAQGVPGYTIKRWFYGGTFDFARLTYYPMPQGQRSYLYWEDGRQMSGDHTPYHKRWVYATATGDAVMQGFLTSLGVSLDGSEKQVPPALNDPASITASARANAAEQNTSGFATVAVIGVASVAIGTTFVVLWWNRRRVVTHDSSAGVQE